METRQPTLGSADIDLTLCRRAPVERNEAWNQQVEVPMMIANLKADAAVDYKGYEALIARTIEVFGNELAASRWLSTPSEDLNGRVPLQVAQKFGYDQALVQEKFEPIFVRIEHGI